MSFLFYVDVLGRILPQVPSTALPSSRRVAMEHNLGPMNRECPYCHALHWAAEGDSVNEYGDCCMRGKVDVPYVVPIPDLLYHLYADVDNDAREFRSHIRRYNKAFAFTSTGGSFRLDSCVFDGRGPPCYKIQGELYHRLGPVAPEDGWSPAYSQLYIWDNAEALEYRRNNNPDNNPDTMRLLQDMFLRCNPFVSVYQQAREIMQNAHVPAYSLRLDFLRACDERRYNTPRAQNELAAIIPGDVDSCINSRQIIIRSKGGPLIRMTECHPAYVALHFPLLAPSGQLSWDPSMRYSLRHRSRRSQGKRNRLTLCNYLQFRLHIRPVSFKSDHYFRSGFLLQEYIVEMWLAAEHSRLRWIRDHQADLRADLYTGVIDALHEGLQPSAIGRKVILPSSFTSGPRFMQKNLQHALTLLRVIGPSDLFITFTANPTWCEIVDNLLPEQTASDHPDIVARVFHLKFASLLNDIMVQKIFGKAIAYVYMVEYQKRGLSHVHLIVFLDRSNRLLTAQRVDSFICSELPDPVKNPHLFELVKTHMIHGPCRSDQCLDARGQCTKGFPKTFQDVTEIVGESYVKTRRRDNGRCIQYHNRQVDNRYVVAHSPYLLEKYRAHINVECTSGFEAIKYIYKVRFLFSMIIIRSDRSRRSMFIKALIVQLLQFIIIQKALRTSEMRSKHISTLATLVL